MSNIPSIAFLIGRVIVGCFLPHERLQPLRATKHDDRICQEQRRTRSRARSGRFGRTSLLRWTEPCSLAITRLSEPPCW
jgi:hypothetical protein